MHDGRDTRKHGTLGGGLVDRKITRRVFLTSSPHYFETSRQYADGPFNIKQPVSE